MLLLTLVFVVGYFAIVLEHWLKLNKSASALLMGVGCWTVHIAAGDPSAVNAELGHHLGEIAQILFFLLAAMTIVEQVDAHDGFHSITSRVTTTSRRTLLFTIAVLTFLLSAILDNLTTAILMMTLVRRLVADEEDRMSYGAIIVVAANAGGAWSPIGDVTTTMLWVGQQITSTTTIRALLLPSLVSVVVPTLWMARRLEGSVRRPGGARRDAVRAIKESLVEASPTGGFTSITLPDEAAAVGKTLAQLNLRARTEIAVVTVARDGGGPAAPSPLEPLRGGDVLTLSGPSERLTQGLDLLITGEGPKPTTPAERRVILLTGVGVLLFVPVFKTLTHLPPVMGILLGLGVLWLVTEVVHKGKEDDRRSHLSVGAALHRVDAQSILFFLGILLAIDALQAHGLLGQLAGWLDRTIGNVDLITIAIGVTSSVVDNVPLVAAAQGMYSLETFPTDHGFWLFLAYCAGTGGSILIIGSAAGIAVMGRQNISFGWYLRRVSLPALVGYGAGALFYVATASLGK